MKMIRDMKRLLHEERLKKLAPLNSDKWQAMVNMLEIQTQQQFMADKTQYYLLLFSEAKEGIVDGIGKVTYLQSIKGNTFHIIPCFLVELSATNWHWSLDFNRIRKKMSHLDNKSICIHGK